MFLKVIPESFQNPKESPLLLFFNRTLEVAKTALVGLHLLSPGQIDVTIYSNSQELSLLNDEKVSLQPWCLLSSLLQLTEKFSSVCFEQNSSVCCIIAIADIDFLLQNADFHNNYSQSQVNFFSQKILLPYYKIPPSRRSLFFRR